jgi:hypothetical protein
MRKNSLLSVKNIKNSFFIFYDFFFIKQMRDTKRILFYGFFGSMVDLIQVEIDRFKKKISNISEGGKYQ